MEETKKVYIILSYSGTMVSRIIKFFTKYEYCHASVSFHKDIDKMYSFGRKTAHNPFNAGLVIETRDNEFFQTFTNTECAVLEIDVSKEQYKKLKRVVKRYLKHKDEYKYDIAGLLLRIFHLKIERKNHYVCTEFVKAILEEAEIYKFDSKIVKAVDFMEMPNKKIIYNGKLLNY